MEEPIYLKRNAATVIKLARIQGAILSCVPEHVAVDEVHPSTWKQGLGLPANADKPQVKKRALELGFDAITPAEDIWDAFDAFSDRLLHARRAPEHARARRAGVLMAVIVERVDFPVPRFASWLEGWKERQADGWLVTVWLDRDETHAIGLACRPKEAKE